MIDAQYAVDCLRQGFERYIRYKRIDATIDIGPNYVSFYVKDIDNTGKQYMARASNHHLKMQRIADKDEPWKGDNISIAFITPKSKQDSQIRATVRQNAHGTIQPFDITTYQYNNTILDKSDLSSIFHSIVSFLNGQGYSDPFKGTAKQAKVLSRHSNIKPYKAPATPTNISIDSNNNNRITTQNGYGADYVSESKDIYNNNIKKTDNCMRNNKRIIRLNESDFSGNMNYPFDLNRVRNATVRELIKAVLSEKVFNEHLLNYYWLSGESTEVAPIMVWADEIDFQLNDATLRDEYEQALRSVCNKHQDLFRGGYVSNYDGSCPIYVRFYYADGVLDRIKNDDDIKTENYMRNNKRTIRLTESDLHRMIRNVVMETIKSEIGMTDDEKRRRRNQRIIDDIKPDRHSITNHWDDEPGFEDYLDREFPFKGQEWVDNTIDQERMKQHHRTQNHYDVDAEPFQESLNRAIRESIERVLRKNKGY